MARDDNMTRETIVIAKTDCESALYVIAKAAMVRNEIEIHYMNKYAPTVEYLLRMLRKGFGWREIDRGMKDVQNTKCIHNDRGFCCCKERDRIKCKESVRLSCSFYRAKYNSTFEVNFVLIEKAGGIRDM